MKKALLLALIGLLLPSFMPFWGFHAHEKINRLAVFTLPPEMIGFYKKNVLYITEASVSPDKRRYVVEEEGPRHFLDIDHYGDSALIALPRAWSDAVQRYGEDSLNAHGVLPWHIVRMYFRLREAFLVGDPSAILKLSAELGHYVADAHVPLHTTKNYNGQLTGQDGIHGFWESRLPELFSNDYDYFVGRAAYTADPAAAAWTAIASAHASVADVLALEKKLAEKFGEKKYAFETRGNTTVKVYAYEYANAYHDALNGMVETQMRASIKMIGDLWYSAWVDAGQPDINKFITHNPSQEELQQNRARLKEWKTKRPKSRVHEN